MLQENGTVPRLLDVIEFRKLNFLTLFCSKKKKSLFSISSAISAQLIDVWCKLVKSKLSKLTQLFPFFFFLNLQQLLLFPFGIILFFSLFPYYILVNVKILKLHVPRVN